MRVDHEENFLIVEKARILAGSQSLRIEARTAGPGWASTVVHDELLVESFEIAVRETDSFTSGRAQRLEIVLSEAGWLRLRRSAHGQVLVRLRIARLKIGAAVEAEFVVEASTAGQFCAELKALIC